MPDSAQPFIFETADGKPAECLGALCTTLVPSAATGDEMGMIELRVPPGGATPMHLHRREVETLHVLAGRFRFWCGHRAWESGEGAAVVLPRGVPHAFRNVGDVPGRLLEIITPGGFERFFEQCGARGLRPPEHAEELRALGAEYGIEIIGPPPAADQEGGPGARR